MRVAMSISAAAIAVTLLASVSKVGPQNAKNTEGLIVPAPVVVETELSAADAA